MKHNSFFLILRSKRQKGQSLLEFILLFAMVVLWGFLLVREANTMIADYWKVVVKIIVNDPTQNIELR